MNGHRQPGSPFIAAALVVAAFAVPRTGGAQVTLQHLPILLALSTGILVSMIFTGYSTSGTPLNSFPLAVSLAVILHGTVESSLIFALVAGMGSLFLESRQGLARTQGRRGAFDLFASVFLLCRLTAFIHLLLIQRVPGLPGCFAALILLTGFTAAAMRFLPVPPELRTRRPAPLLFNLFPLPMVIPVLEARNDPQSLLAPLAGTVFLLGVVQVGAFLLTTRRRALERSMDMERALADLTAGLTSAGTGAAALKMLVESLLRGSGASRVTAGRGNLSMSLPVHNVYSACSVSRSLSGLWAVLEFPAVPLVNPERVDAFLTRTAVMLEWILVTETINRETWETVETLVLSLERTDSRLAEFSKGVAATVSELAEAMGFDSWSVNSLRVASLLHAGAEAITGGLGRQGVSDNESASLPPVTLDALKYHNEFWDGSGPQGLKGADIPTGARILAVGVNWEKALTSGGVKEAVRAMRMGSGLLYDPSITALLLESRAGRS